MVAFEKFLYIPFTLDVNFRGPASVASLDTMTKSSTADFTFMPLRLWTTRSALSILRDAAVVLSTKFRLPEEAFQKIKLFLSSKYFYLLINITFTYLCVAGTSQVS